MSIQEIRLQDLKAEAFIEEQCRFISAEVGNSKAINRDGKRDYGFQIEIRCWDSKDAVTASPTKLPFDLLRKLAGRMTSEVPGVVSVTYNITTKPPSTIEAV